MSKTTFEDDMKKLDEIVSMLEKNDASLAESIENFEEGLLLVKKLDKQLKEYEDKVNEIINNSKGE